MIENSKLSIKNLSIFSVSRYSIEKLANTYFYEIKNM